MILFVKKERTIPYNLYNVNCKVKEVEKWICRLFCIKSVDIFGHIFKL